MQRSNRTGNGKRCGCWRRCPAESTPPWLRRVPSTPDTTSPASIWPCPRTRSPSAAAPAGAAPRRTPTTPAGRPTGSASPSTSGISATSSPPTWWTTSSPSTPRAGPRTRACAATRRSSSPPCCSVRWPWVSTPCAPGTTPDWCRVRKTSRHGIELHRAVDVGKDQSYVLGVLTQDQLRHSLFPLGDSLKTEVRAEAERRGLAVADKPDSHDICFIADGDTGGFLDRQLGTRPGLIADETGAAVGQHDGTHHFTDRPAQGAADRDSRPRTGGRATCWTSHRSTNTVTVGPREALSVRRIAGVRPTWTDRPGVGPWRGSGPGPGARRAGRRRRSRWRPTGSSPGWRRR